MFSLLILNMACSVERSPSGQGSEIGKHIAAFKAEATCRDAHIKEMEFRGRSVYVFDYGSCVNDRESPVRDERGVLLGNLGGFIGNTTIEGEDFSKAKLKREVWKNSGSDSP